MYMAQMYCYGSDPECAGITGIVGCMGIICACRSRVFAVHIPPSGATMEKRGREAFCDYVTREMTEGTGAGRLLFFVNGKCRPQAPEEVRAVCGLLGIRTAKLIKLWKHLGDHSGDK